MGHQWNMGRKMEYRLDIECKNVEVLSGEKAKDVWKKAIKMTYRLDIHMEMGYCLNLCCSDL